jgi:hypothetical protein
MNINITIKTVVVDRHPTADDYSRGAIIALETING